jgi:site-specific recombinase XerD
MPSLPRAIQQFRAYWQRRHYSPHTLDSYTLDLQGFCADIERPLARLAFREVACVLDTQHPQGVSPATINRRLYA